MRICAQSCHARPVRGSDSFPRASASGEEVRRAIARQCRTRKSRRAERGDKIFQAARGKEVVRHCSMRSRLVAMREADAASSAAAGVKRMMMPFKESRIYMSAQARKSGACAACRRA